MIRYHISIYILLGFIQGCGYQKQFVEEPVSSENNIESVANQLDEVIEETPGAFILTGPSLVFYAPGPDEMGNMDIDNATREGLSQAVGDFAYYASIVTDSLEGEHIQIHFTNERHIVLGQEPAQFDFSPEASNSLMGIILFDGEHEPTIQPGMQTHYSMLATIKDFFHVKGSEQVPLLDYFDEANSKSLHIYSSHSDILNQTGKKIDYYYYSRFGNQVTDRADRFSMSMYAYQKFQLDQGKTAIICRIPSVYDESLVKLYVWDSAHEKVIGEIQLAENVWNEQWIMVQDSWISLGPDSTFTIVQRKKEARMEEGVRSETDSLFHWIWTGKLFKSLPTTGLASKDFKLKDWESYQEPKAPAKITITDEDYVWLPLETGDITWENIMLQMPKPYSIDKEPIENHFIKGQIDTLVTISTEQLSFRYYRSPTVNTIVSGKITGSSIKLKNGLMPGMSKTEFTSIFNNLPAGGDIPNQITIRSKSGDRVISCHFQNDSLSSIELTNYLY